jgi:hypothetical protein
LSKLPKENRLSDRQAIGQSFLHPAKSREVSVVVCLRLRKGRAGDDRRDETRKKKKNENERVLPDMF